MQRHERRELARAMVDDGGAGAAASFLYNSALSQPTPQPRILAHAAGGGPRSARPDAEAAEAAERRQLHGLHIALSSCRQEKDALEKTLRHETGRLRQQLVAVTEEHDALLGRQQTSDAVISKLQDREDRAARLENSVELRRELGDVAEAALTTARDRILALEADLAASLLRINRLEEGDDLRHTSLLAQCDEAAAEAAAAHAEKVATLQREQESREKQTLEQARSADVLHSLESENAEMQQHLRMLSEKMAVLNEQLELANAEIGIVAKARDAAQRSLTETQTHLDALKAELVAATEQRVQQATQEHMERQMWLETALRSAFAQEQALREAHAVQESSWAERSAGCLAASVLPPVVVWVLVIAASD